MTIRMVFAALMTVSLVHAAQMSDKPTKDAIDELAWLVGDWQSSGAGGKSTEYWFPAEAGAMFGLNRTIRGDKVQFFEFLRIEEIDGVLTYFANPKGQAGAPFKLVKLEKNRVEFANPQHDYPQRIIYTRDADKLSSRIEGPDKDGSTKSSEWHWNLKK